LYLNVIVLFIVYVYDPPSTPNPMAMAL